MSSRVLQPPVENGSRTLGSRGRQYNRAVAVRGGQDSSNVVTAARRAVSSPSPRGPARPRRPRGDPARPTVLVVVGRGDDGVGVLAAGEADARAEDVGGVHGLRGRKSDRRVCPAVGGPVSADENCRGFLEARSSRACVSNQPGLMGTDSSRLVPAGYLESFEPGSPGRPTATPESPGDPAGPARGKESRAGCRACFRASGGMQDGGRVVWVPAREQGVQMCMSVDSATWACLTACPETERLLVETSSSRNTPLVSSDFPRGPRRDVGAEVLVYDRDKIPGRGPRARVAAHPERIGESTGPLQPFSSCRGAETIDEMRSTGEHGGKETRVSPGESTPATRPTDSHVLELRVKAAAAPPEKRLSPCLKADDSTAETSPWGGVASVERLRADLVLLLTRRFQRLRRGVAQRE
ncbi:unnamed protein product [Diplocarpon coronariae]